MPTLQELKASSPAYQALSDEEFADRLYNRHYANRISREEFNARVGLPAPVTLDTTTGAPMAVRGLVGSSPQQDRLANAQQYLPGAQPYADWAAAQGMPPSEDMADNFVFPGAEGRPTLYNPQGLDWGDAMSVGRDIATTAGGGLGAVAGTLAAAPTGGLAAPVTGAVGGALGAAAGGQVFDLVQNNLLGRIDTRNIGQRLGGAGVDAAMEIAGAGLGAGVGRVARSAGPMVRRIIESPGAAARLQDFQEAGVAPMAGAVGGRAVAGAESAASNLLTSQATIRTAAERTVDDMGERLAEIARRYGRATTGERAARSMRRGAQTFVDTFQMRGTDLYSTVGKLLPAGPNTVVTTANTQAALAGPMQTFTAGAVQNPALGEALTPPIMRSLLEALQTTRGQLTWEQLQYFRTRIGQRLVGNPALADASRAEYESLYGAIASDMEAAAANAGPRAERAYARAVNYWRSGRQRIDTVIQDIFSSDMGSQAFDEAFRSGRSGADRLYALRRSMPAEVWGDVASAALHQMGRSLPSAGRGAEDVFSPQTFITNWRRLRPEAQAALFRGTRYAEMVPALDRIARLAGYAEDAGRMANTSRTAPTLSYQSLLTGGGSALAYLVFSPVGAVTAATGTLVGPYAAAKLMTNPRFVQWLARGTAIPAGDRAGLASHIGRLTASLSQEDEDVQEAALEYLQGLQAVMSQATPQ